MRRLRRLLHLWRHLHRLLRHLLRRLHHLLRIITTRRLIARQQRLLHVALLCLLCTEPYALQHDNADDEHDLQSERHQQREHHVLRDAHDDVAHERQQRHHHRIHRLRLHVHHEVALRGHRRENRIVANRRDIISKHRPAQTRRNARHHQSNVRLPADADHDGDQHAEARPRGAQRRRQHGAHEKDYRRHHPQRHAAAGDQRAHVLSRLQQRAAHAADGPREDQNDQRVDHPLHPLQHLLHEHRTTQQSPRHVEEETHQQRHEGAAAQRGARVGVGEDLPQRLLPAEAAAQVDHEEHREDDAGQDRQEKVPHRPVRVRRLLALGVDFGTVAVRGALDGVLLVGAHASDAHVKERRRKDEHEI